VENLKGGEVVKRLIAVALAAFAALALTACGNGVTYQADCTIVPDAAEGGGSYGQISVELASLTSEPVDPKGWSVHVFRPDGTQVATAPFPAPWVGSVAGDSSLRYTGAGRAELYPLTDTCRVAGPGG
jgi:hypothetical protein